MTLRGEPASVSHRLSKVALMEKANLNKVSMAEKYTKATNVEISLLKAEVNELKELLRIKENEYKL